MLKIALKIVGTLFLFAMSMPLSAQKTDKVFLRNGDTVTGEIKGLKFAKLSFDMTGPGTIQIKWEEIIKILSDKQFQITLKGGEVLLTSLDSVFLKTKNKTLDDIVEIVRIKDRFLQRMQGDVNLGFNYAKSSDILQFNFNGGLTYVNSKNETNLKINSVISKSSADTALAKKQDVSTNYFRKLRNLYYINGLLGWQQNTQLGIRNRFIITGAGGKILINNNHQRLLTGTGLTYNYEQSSLSDAYIKNLEALFIIQYKKFHYSSPKISLDAYFVVYPSLSNWGRVRMDFQISSKFEVFKDFFIGLNFYDNYDNRPPKGAASQNDFGINFTVGYEFGK